MSFTGSGSRSGNDSPPIQVLKSMTSDEGGKFHLEISLPIGSSKAQYLLRAVKQDRGMGVLAMRADDGNKYFFDTLRQTSLGETVADSDAGDEKFSGTVMDDQDHPVAGCKITDGLADPITTGADGQV